jgi:hypothetical protein
MLCQSFCCGLVPLSVAPVSEIHVSLCVTVWSFFWLWLITIFYTSLLLPLGHRWLNLMIHQLSVALYFKVNCFFNTVPSALLIVGGANGSLSAWYLPFNCITYKWLEVYAHVWQQSNPTIKSIPVALLTQNSMVPLTSNVGVALRFISRHRKHVVLLTEREITSEHPQVILQTTSIDLNTMYRWIGVSSVLP